MQGGSSLWTVSAYDVVVCTLIEMVLVPTMPLAVRASILTLQMPASLRAALAAA